MRNIHVWDGPVEEGKNPGRCWIYSALSPLRQRVCARLGLTDVRFSTGYLFYYDQFRKCRRFLQRVQDTRELPLEDPSLRALLNTPVSSEGRWNDFASLVWDYGLVPLSVMPDNPRAMNGESLTNALSQRLRYGAWQIREQDESLEDIMSDICGILQEYLGTPMENFFWNGQYTARGFFQTYCARNLENYVTLMQSQRGMLDGVAYQDMDPPELIRSGEEPFRVLLSLSMKDLKGYVLHQICMGSQVVVSADTRYFCDLKTRRFTLEKDSDWFSYPGRMDKDTAIAYRQVEPIRHLTLDGVTLGDDDQVKSWHVRDCYGFHGGVGGVFQMDDDWFDAFVFSAVIQKTFLSREHMEALDRPRLL